MKSGNGSAAAAEPDAAPQENASAASAGEEE
jgi:hypothetical protein